MGTTIIESNRLDASYNVVFYRPGRTLYVQAGLDPVTRTCAITHELGHTHYAHDCSTQLEVTHAHIKNLAALPGWSHHIPMLTTKPRPCD